MCFLWLWSQYAHILVRVFFVVPSQCFLTASPHTGSSQGALGWEVSFVRALIPPWRLHLMTQTPPKGPTSLHPHIGIMISAYGFGAGVQTFRLYQLLLPPCIWESDKNYNFCMAIWKCGHSRWKKWKRQLSAWNTQSNIEMHLDSNSLFSLQITFPRELFVLQGKNTVEQQQKNK